MSQQMEFSDSSHERSGTSSGGYEGVPNYNYNAYSGSSKGQKLSVNQLLEPFLILGFLIFTAMVFLINMMFNRKH